MSMYEMNKDQKVQHATAKKLFDANNLTNNTDLSTKLWAEAIQYRRDCIKEFITFLETGKKDHIKISQKYPTKEKKENTEHFK